MTSDAGQVIINWVDAICELRPEKLNAVFCNNTKSGIETSPKFEMSQTKTSASRAIFWNADVISKYVFIFT